MQPQELQRIRMLENRMRRPSRPANNNNEESLKSIKSTDSKKIVMPLFKLQEERNKLSEEAHEDTPQPLDHLTHIRLSEEEIKANRKITDYFKVKKIMATPQQQQKSPLPMPLQIAPNPIPVVPLNNKSPLREREELLCAFRAEIVQSTIELHRLRRNELRQRVNHNKQRLGQHRLFHMEKGNTEMWIDGSEIKHFKRKLEQLKKSKEVLDRSKRQARRGKDQDQNEDWKITLNSQSYFLSRQQSYCDEMLKRLQDQKAVHIKEYRLLYEEDNSKYGKLVAMGSQSWPLIRKYQLLGLLGKGGFSEVYKGYDSEQLRQVAVKIHQFSTKWNLQARDNYIKHAQRQNNVHKMLSHPNIVRLYDTVEIDPNSFCTVLQFCEGPDLSFYLKKYKKIPQKQAKLIIRQVISAIRYLHQLPEKVIHYDLKPQNILFHKGVIKITDFGLCKITKEDTIELTSQGVGTYWYLPPQCFQQQKTLITPKVDVWSIGVIYFQMLYGQKPFGNAMTQLRILKEGIMLRANTVNFPNTQKGIISDESKQFIRECLQFKCQQRLDIQGVANHKIFEKR